MNTNNLFFKTLDLSPSTFPNKSNNQHQHIRIADILADDDEEDSVVEFGMGARRSDASTSLHCSFPHRIIVKWLAALRRRGKERTIFNVVPAQKREEKKEATVFAGGTLHTRRSENGLDGRDSSLPPSESEDSNSLLYFFSFVFFTIFLKCDCFICGLFGRDEYSLLFKNILLFLNSSKGMKYV
jgi:hypothetical protein